MKRHLANHLTNHLGRLLNELRGLNSPHEEMKVLKRLKLRLKDRIAAIERGSGKRGGPSLT